MGKKHHIQKNNLSRPNIFGSFIECVRWAKKSVFIVVRGRNDIGSNSINWMTLGSGFVAAPYRFVTAAHVINDPDNPDPMARHKPDDFYYLLRHDDDDSWQYQIYKPTINKELFVFPDEDIAIIYLDDNFYKFAQKSDYLRITRNLIPIGAEVGVLGYPLCKLEFENRDINKPKVGDILIRTDKGVLNCRYHTDAKTYIYEFTMNFNPGNSGGPIFDTKTGEVISIVKGFKTIKLKVFETALTPEELRLIKTYKDTTYIQTLYTNYSIGFASKVFTDILVRHQII